MENQFFNRPEFQCLGKEKIALIQELSEKGKGKDPMELMVLFHQYEKKLSDGRPVTPEERKAILLVIRENLGDEEKMRMDKMIAMMNLM